MTMRVCVLGSGSGGNCTLIQSDRTALLVDAGLSSRQTKIRLEEIGLSLDEIDGIVIGHEHGDHVKGLDVIARRWGGPVFMNRATREAVAARESAPWQVKIFTNGQDFSLGDLTIHPFSVFHDAQDPVGFSVRRGEINVVVATDLGTATRLVREELKGAWAAVLEANHDPDLLANGSRPWALKQRINSSQGHLSNEAAGDLLASSAGERLRDVFLAHLSRECNRPELALETVRRRLPPDRRERIKLRLTYPDRISEVVVVGEEADLPAAPASSPADQMNFFNF